MWPRIEPARLPFDRTAAYRRYGPRLDADRLNPEELYTKALLEEQGFDGLPRVITAAELDGYVRAGEVELFRGTLAAHAEQLRSGALWVGRGAHGGGIYTAGGPDALPHAADYAQDPDSVIVRMTLKAGARVADAEWLEQTTRPLQIGVPPSGPLAGLAPGAVMALSAFVSRYAAYFGYDAVADRRQGVWLVLNRTAVRVQDRDLQP